MNNKSNWLVICMTVIIVAVAGYVSVAHDWRYATVRDVKNITDDRLDRIEKKIDQLLKREGK